MASQYNIQPGISESISNQDIGTFALNQWQHIKLDGYFLFLGSGLVLKQGTTVIPPSAYELAQDDNATAQEVGLTGDTLIGMIRITNVSYTGVTLNVTCENFGTYVSNQSVIEYVTAQIATKVGPIGSNIAEGEKAIFSGSSGLGIETDNSSGISLWGSGTTYGSAGTLVRIEGSTYSSTGLAGNLNKDPRLLENAIYWFTPPEDKVLEFYAKQGTVLGGGMHRINDRASAQYQQNMLIASKSYNSAVYEFHMIHLDGTQVTGNSTLEGLLNVGAGNENPYLDYFAPDILGTRTLIDMGGRVTEAMTSGGVVDTMGEVHDDYMQRITGDFTTGNSAQARDCVANASGVFTPSGSSGNGMQALGSPTGFNKVDFDSANSTSPNPAKTNDDRTAHAALVEGISYIIVMVAA